MFVKQTKPFRIFSRKRTRKYFILKLCNRIKQVLNKQLSEKNTAGYLLKTYKQICVYEQYDCEPSMITAVDNLNRLLVYGKLFTPNTDGYRVCPGLLKLMALLQRCWGIKICKLRRTIHMNGSELWRGI